MVHALSRLPTSRFRRLRRLEYEHLVEAGFIRDERIELLYGQLVEMSPQGRAHAFAVRRLTNLLPKALAGRAEVTIQLPFAALDDSEPEPDVAIVPCDDYMDGHPSKAFLVIEVADSSLPDDRIKRGLYAKAGVPEYWIVNLVDEVVERYTQLEAGEYRRSSRHAPGERLAVPSFPDVEVAVGDIIPPS